MANKPLVIDVESSVRPTGVIDAWANLENADKFISGIKTPPLNKNTNIASLVSGIPSAFARVDLFRSALHSVAAGNNNQNAQNLESYYDLLVNEWKGMIACLALDYQNINAYTIDLAYSDFKEAGETINLYEPKGAFGNMLMNRRKLWSDLTLSENETIVPRLTIIKYKGKVIGATAPDTFVFTSSGYSLTDVTDDTTPWVNRTNGQGKFTDPLKSEMTGEELARLYAYVNNIIEKSEEYIQYYSVLEENVRPDIGSIVDVLRRWKEEIEGKAAINKIDLLSASIPAVQLGFCAPFNNIFNHKEILYGIDGLISSNSRPGSIEFNPADVLLPETAKIARFILPDLTRNPEKLRDQPMYMLKARKKGTTKEWAYFALPLSPLGINIYGKTIGALVGMQESGHESKSKLEAVYDADAKTLEVTLQIKTEDGRIRPTTRVYKVGSDDSLQNKDIILWPNFIAHEWDRYFLYSELPHNNPSQTYAAYPFVGETDDEFFRIMTDEDNRPLMLAKDGKILDSKGRVNAKLLVEANNKVNEMRYKYEIYESNKPFKGLRLQSPTGEEGGYLIINYSSSVGEDQLPINYLNNPRRLEEASLGMDFGSTNTSIAYGSANSTGQGFEFKNRRVSLLGNKRSGVNEILFFQGPEIPISSNAIKSILTLHDERRLHRDNNIADLGEVMLGKEVVGGFPCFEENLPVKAVSGELIELEYPASIGIVKQIHNMKWNNTAIDNAHKKAYLKTLLLQVYAELFALDKVPTSLTWSFPSSMSRSLLTSYQIIWDSLSVVSPVINTTARRKFDLKVSQAPISLDFGYANDGGLGVSVNDLRFGGDINAGVGGLSNGFGEMRIDMDSGLGSLGSGLDSGLGGLGGGFGNLETGFGSLGADMMSDFGSSTEQSPMTAPATVELKPDSQERVVSYKPKLLINQHELKSMSEATAVANYMMAYVGNSSHQLILTIDIGGSTTDISALYMLDGEKDSRMTMIKQNSLRFAAQRVSTATSSIKSFKQLLQSVCAQTGITMRGFNEGVERFNDDTAPYYFDQLVSRLNEQQLVAFYRQIGANCKDLLAINLYVTGLLAYYAGEVAHKLLDDIQHAVNDEVTDKSNKPKVIVSFAGKGSRLLHWLAAINSQVATQYYNTMFAQGFGQSDMVRLMNVQGSGLILPKLENNDIKYEVSKGLVSNMYKLYEPSGDSTSEIIGEDGFQLIDRCGSSAPVSYINTLVPEMIERIGINFKPGPVGQNGLECQRFYLFCTIFDRVIRSLGIEIPQNTYLEGLRDMNIVQYVQNMPEFMQARASAVDNNGKFDFVAPIIIIEGMKFYDKYLLNYFRNK